MVGDDDQAIYTFQGATGSFAHFEAAYSHAPHAGAHRAAGVRVCKLEHNYRSSGAIVRVATALVAHNTQRKPKTAYTASAVGERVELVECRSLTLTLTPTLHPNPNPNPTM